MEIAGILLILGGLTTDRNGIQDQAYEFGVNKYLRLENNMTASVKAISFWVYSTSKSEEQMYWIVDTQRELYNSFGSNYYFSFPRSCEELIYHLPRLMNGTQ